MNKLYALAILLVFGFSAHAQLDVARRTTKKQLRLQSGTLPQPLAVQDSILDAPFWALNEPDCDTNVTIYCAPGGVTPAGNCRAGYLSGNNQFGDKEKLMKFYWPYSGTIRRALMATGAKTQTNATANTYAVAYNVMPDGSPDSSSRTLSSAIRMVSVVDNGYTTYTFSNAPFFADSFFVGIVLPTTPGDTIAVYSSPLGTPPCAGPGTNRAWERQADGSFVAMSSPSAWGVAPWFWNAELLIAAEVRYDDVIATKDLLGKLVSVRPVPAENNVMVSLPSNIAGSTTWQILTSDGRVVNSSTAANSSAFVQIERGNLPAGVYTLRLNTVGGPVNKRIVFSN